MEKRAGGADATRPRISLSSVRMEQMLQSELPTVLLAEEPAGAEANRTEHRRANQIEPSREREVSEDRHFVSL
jgi:hypothetical protein